MTHAGTNRPDADLPPASAGRRAVRWRAAELLLAVALAGVVFALFQNPTRHIDELYHVLAAKSLLADGDLVLGETGEPYTRAKAYTYAVAASFRWFGEGLWQSRLPSLLAGLVLVAVLFGWSRRRFGSLTAWVTLGLMLQMPMMVYATELCRFYMVQAAAVVCLLASADTLLDRAAGVWLRLLSAVVAALSGWLAMHVQVSSVFGVGLVCGGVLLGVLWRVTEGRPRQGVLRGWGIALGLVLGGAGLAAGLLWLEPVRGLWDGYRASVLWASDARDDPAYYLDYFLLWHRWPLLLSLPAAGLACYRWRWRAIWVVAFFTVGLAAHSFAGMKAPRYLLWAFPYLALTLGMGVSAVVWLLTRRPGRAESLAPLRMRIGVAAVVLAVFTYALSRTLGPYQVRSMLFSEEHAFVFADWDGARPVLEADSAWAGGVLLASADVKAMDALGRCDYSLSRTRAEDREEFDRDWRTGMPVVYTPSAVGSIVEREPAGLVVVEEAHWRQPWGVPAPLADWLEARLQRVPLDPAMQLLAFRWDRRGGTADVPGGD
jgi:4-amino-4-deoxy-L-arabinose transferase-like glycosyltransferase